MKKISRDRLTGQNGFCAIRPHFILRRQRWTKRMMKYYQETRLRDDSCEPHGRSCSPTGWKEDWMFRLKYSFKDHIDILCEQGLPPQLAGKKMDI